MLNQLDSILGVTFVYVYPYNTVYEGIDFTFYNTHTSALSYDMMVAAAAMVVFVIIVTLYISAELSF